MRRYTVAQFRRHLADALDEVERGVPVVIERRGVRYSLQPERASSRRRSPGPSVIEILDPAVAAGEWDWTWTPRGLRFRARRRTR